MNEPEGESSSMDSIMGECGREKSPEGQIFEREIRSIIEPMSFDSRRNKKRKTDEKAMRFLDNPEKPSETFSDSERRKRWKIGESEKEYEMQTTAEEQAEITPTLVYAKDSSRDFSMNKKTTDEPSTAQKITMRRREVPEQKLNSKNSSTIGKELKLSTVSDPEQPNTSGENLVLSKKLSESENKVLADAKMKLQRLNIPGYLKLSPKEDEIFNELHLDLTLKVMTATYRIKVKDFFKKHLKNPQDSNSLISNARKLEDWLQKMNWMIWNVPKLPMQQPNKIFIRVKNLSDIMAYLSGGYRVHKGEAFDFNKIDRFKFFKMYNSYVQQWVITVKNFEKKGDDVHKKMEALRLTIRDAIKKCEDGMEFINKLKTYKHLKEIAVLQRSHQIGEDITRPPHVGYDIPDYYLEKVKECYLNPVKCTDELHILHTERSNDNELQNSSGSFEEACRELLQNENSEMAMANFLGKQFSGIQLGSSDVQLTSTDPSSKLIKTKDTTGVQQFSDASKFQPTPSTSTSGIERSSTGKEHQGIQSTTFMERRKNQHSSIDTNSQLYLLLTSSNDVKQKQTNTKCEPNQPLICTDVQQGSDLNCPTITTFDENSTLTGHTKNLAPRRLFQEYEGNVSDSKDQNKSGAKVSSDTNKCESCVLNIPVYRPFANIGEQKATTNNNPELNPIRVPGFSDQLSPQKQTTSTPVKREDGRKFTDCMEFPEDLSENESTKDVQSENESTKDVQSENGSTKDVLSENESMKDVQSENGSTKDVQSENESTKDVQSENESMKDVQSENGSTKDIQSENESMKDTKRENMEDFQSEYVSMEDFPGEYESIEDFQHGNDGIEFDSSSDDSENRVCDKSIELDELHDQLWLIAEEIDEFGKLLEELLDDTQLEVKNLVDAKRKFDQNLHQFLKMDIPGLVKK